MPPVATLAPAALDRVRGALWASLLGFKGANGGSGCVEMVATIHNVQCKGLHSPWAAQDEEPKPLHPAVPQSGLQLVTI